MNDLSQKGGTVTKSGTNPVCGFMLECVFTCARASLFRCVFVPVCERVSMHDPVLFPGGGVCVRVCICLRASWDGRECAPTHVCDCAQPYSPQWNDVLVLSASALSGRPAESPATPVRGPRYLRRSRSPIGPSKPRVVIRHWGTGLTDAIGPPLPLRGWPRDGEKD